MRFFAISWLLLVLLIVLFSSACSSKQEEKKPPNIILIIADDLSWEHLGTNGQSGSVTPNIDRLAETGVLFTNAFVSTSSCTPSRASLLTGRNGFELEQGAVLWGYLPKKFTTYPEVLESHGYKVGATGKGWGPGFLMDRPHNPAGKLYNELEHDPYGLGEENVWLSRNDYVANFETFLKDAGEKPFCFWMGTFEPHLGYAPGLAQTQYNNNLESVIVPDFLPDDSIVRNDLLDYTFEVAHIDKQLGRLLDVLKASNQLNNTLIIFTSDNGMPFPRAKATLYDYGTKVPLVAWWGANIKGGRKISDLISLTDIAPTLLEAAQMNVPQEISGKSFLSQIVSENEGRIDSSRNKVILYRERHSFCCAEGKTFASRGIRTDDYLLIWNLFAEIMPKDVDGSPTKQFLLNNEDTYPELFELSFGRRAEFELYDVQSDPYQMNNLDGKASFREIQSKLTDELLMVLQERQDPRVTGNTDVFKHTPYFGFLFEMGLLNWSDDRDGRRLSETEIAELLQQAYSAKGEEKLFEKVAASEGWKLQEAK